MPPEPRRVGIVTRTRDRPLFVVRALAAVLAQTCGDWRIVLVNDGGDPAALRAAIAAAGIAPSLPPGRLAILDNPAARGRAAAFNQGLAALDTEFVACLDDDDTWHPEFLATLLALYDANAPLIPDLGGVAAGVTALREDLVVGPDGRMRIEPLGEDGLPNAFRRADFLIGPIAYATYRHDLYPVQWLLRRQAVADLGGFPERFEVMEDRAFLLRFVQHWRIATSDRRLAFHHRRVRRQGDTGQTAELNTLDNPSYDWRRFSDLALPALTTPAAAAGAAGAPAPGADLPGLMRAVGASIVRELNDETSALWHKVNGEAAGLRARLEALEARLVPGGVAAAEATADLGRPPAWSLWAAAGPAQIGYAIAPATPVLDRLSLSYPGTGAGLLLHADPDRRLMQLQVPQTGDWCALELALDGLGQPDRPLQSALVMALPAGGLFETALVVAERDRLGRIRSTVAETHVHAADAGVPLRLRRDVPAPRPDGTGVRKLSIVLPRQAANLRLWLHDWAVAAG